MAVSHFFGMNPGAHHLANVIVHVASSLLVFLFFYKVTGCRWRSFFVFAVFALHPLHVESVAWVAERKDVLSAFFWFLTLLFYSHYVEDKKRSYYVFTLCAFVMGLMSKAMMVTMPLAMILLDFWPLDRFNSPLEGQGAKSKKQRLISILVIEKLPFFALSLGTGIMAVYAQHQEGALRTIDEVSFVIRLENAAIAYCKYIILTFWPHDLAVLYPMEASFSAWEICSSLIAISLVSAFVIKYRRRFPYALFGWFWFIITLLPVIGILQFGLQSIADRYMYIPMVGISIIAAWGVSDILRDFKYKVALMSISTSLIIMAMTVVTYRQVHYWQDDFSLFGHALNVTKENPICNNMLGVAFEEKGDIESAMKQFRQAVAVNPNYTVAIKNLGVAYYKKGQYDDAIMEFQKIIRLDPNDTSAFMNLQKIMQKKLTQMQ
jgi:protein O-mannosyl-transferase